MENNTENKLILSISYKLLPGLVGWLSNIPLPSKESNARVSFIALCKSGIESIYKSRDEIIKKYAKLNEDGTPKLDKETNKFFYEGDNQKKADEEYAKFLESGSFDIDINDGNIQKVKIIKDIVLNTSEKFQGQLAEQYSKWYEIFENFEI